MADPLSLLRQFNVGKREIIQRGDYICFGENCWPKTTNTNYLVYTSKDGPIKKYYTIECFVFFLKHLALQHAVYVKQAAAEKVPVVSRPDRKDLLQYLSGETVTSASIDKSAPIELAVPLSEVKRLVPDASEESALGAAQSAGDEPANKKFRSGDDVAKARENWEQKLDAPRIRKLPPGSALSAAVDANAATSSLTEAMSLEKIAALKAKRMAIKRSTIIDAENDIDRDGATGTGLSAVGTGSFFQFDASETKEIQSKERIWRNRSTILQSTGKNFAKSVFPLLQSIKSREDGHQPVSGKKPGGPQASVTVGNGPAAMAARQLTTPANMTMASREQMTQQQYNRYDQERFSKNADVGFKIDTTGTYHGLTLKSVTEGPTGIAGQTTKSPMSQSPNYGSQNGSSSPGTPKKRTSKTPIILIPATNTSLITMINAKSILQDLRFVDGNDGKRENEVLVQRSKSDGTTVPYRILDNHLKLAPEDWDRVVAVFVQGPAWQFKGWPWGGNPTEIFARIKGFHIKFDETKLDANVSKWAVDVIELSRTRRHLDRARLQNFWNILDAYMIKHKHFLRH